MKHVALVALVMATACIAPAPEPSDPGELPDDDDDGDPVQPLPPGGDTDTNACVQPATPPGTGHHNAGANCVGCHTGTSAAPLWTAAGTLYTATGAAAVGATITIVDSNNKSISIVTAQNGNFWTRETLKAPLRVKASRCPTTASMTASASGACNSCHTSSGSPGRIKLP